jgi:hypothetical protein
VAQEVTNVILTPPDAICFAKGANPEKSHDRAHKNGKRQGDGIRRVTVQRSEIFHCIAEKEQRK